jgi:hypothetical protein
MNKIGDYIERAPEAKSGQGGHNTTLRVARTLYNGFALSRDQVLEWLRVYNARLSEKWTPENSNIRRTLLRPEDTINPAAG